jgi:predicted nucleic-acid-binding Zn-ribbon protein
MAMTKCPKCGSDKIDPGHLYGAGAVAYKSDQHRLIFKPTAKSYACLDCGYVETYVDPEYLKRISDTQT